MQKVNDEWKDYKNGNQDTDQQVQKGGMSEYPESLSIVSYTRELTRKETAETNEVDRPRRKPNHDRVKTKKSYRCRDDKHLIRDCTVGLKSWGRMQPCYICRKTGHKATNCWFTDQKPGEKQCFCCGSNEHIVKNCTEPRQANASLAMVICTR